MIRNWTWLLVCWLAFGPSSAFAQTETQQKIDFLQRQLDQLRAETQEFPVLYQASPSDVMAGPAANQPLPSVPSNYFQAPSPSFATTAVSAEPVKANTYPEVKVTGFFQLDWPTSVSRWRVRRR